MEIGDIQGEYGSKTVFVPRADYYSPFGGMEIGEAIKRLETLIDVYYDDMDAGIISEGGLKRLARLLTVSREIKRIQMQS